MSLHPGPCLPAPCLLCTTLDAIHDMTPVQLTALADQEKASARDKLAELVEMTVETIARYGEDGALGFLTGRLASMHPLTLPPLMAFALVQRAKESISHKTITRQDNS